MKLIDLRPCFVGQGGEGVTKTDGSPVPRREGIGMNFNCPCGCGRRTHIPFNNPMDGGAATETEHDTWQRIGGEFETMTLKPSINRTGSPCKWHGWLTDGVFKSV